MINGKTFLFSEIPGDDNVTRIASAMALLRENPGATLYIEPGVYPCTTELARKTQDECMRGVYGSCPEPVMFSPKFAYSRIFDFTGQKNTTVSAFGVKLLIDGFLEPVSLRECEGVTVRGLTIDYLRKPYSRGYVTNCQGVGEEHSSFDVVVGDQYPIYEGTPFDLRYYYYDDEKSRLDEDGMQNASGKLIAPQTVRYSGQYLRKNIDGKEFYIWHTYHYRPAILMEYAKDIAVEDMTIHCQPGMGVTGNRCENIRIERLRVVPGDGGHLSTNTDATHFSACRGNMTIRGCWFEGQGDDALNCHGYYHTILKKSADGLACTTKVDAPTGTHAQTLDYPDVGDTLELTRFDSLEPIDTYHVTSVVCRPEDWETDLTLDKPLPDDTNGLLLFDITGLPHLVFTENTDRDHFARSVLIKTRSAVVTKNHFSDVMGTPICLFPESWWYEGCVPGNIVIEDNECYRCGYLGKPGGTGGIRITVDCDRENGAPIKNVRIANNRIYAPHSDRAMYLKHIDGLSVADNICIVPRTGVAALIEDCENVETDTN